LMAFMAMRAQHMDEVILPAVKEGQIILCDRFTDATYAYQGSGRKIETQIIDALNAMVTKGIRPNLTILLDISVEKGLMRRAAASDMDRIEAEEISFHQRVREAYTRLAKEDPKRFFVVDANLKVGAIHDLIKTKVGNILRSYGI
ncbi:MAG: dTMP kinase, partial [Deltaproteobacteria bacterium]|nr:dTMP kinase [Deltaproteobacteria bacterium]